MPLFQNAILKKHLKGTEEKISDIYLQYTAYFHNPEIQENIRNSKEEQFQEGFLRELFVKILGYTLNPEPNFNLITEKKNETDSKKADGAILVNGEVVGVIELKDGKTTDLKQVEPQAFGYKNHHRNASYVVISNFEKLRFYIDNAIDFIEFNLFMLNREEFALLWLCLDYQNIAGNLPKQIKTESVSSEDQITKQLYKEYSAFKRALFDDLTKLNPDYDKLSLFKKSQKLLDRLLFILFAEDCGLLPPNSIVEIVGQWETLKEMDAYSPLYERLKKYFGYMNTGFKGQKHDIFAYNGGLFKPDEMLDNIRISDEALYPHLMSISRYDFSSEVDVNILGHIFENSLTEIEEVTNVLLTDGYTPSSTSKRKKDGVFYTPRYITTYIVENTLGKLCADKKAELEIDEAEYFADKKRQIATKKKLDEKLKDYRDWLLGLTICDPACGSGAFLNAALDFLMSEHKLIDEMTAKLLGKSIVFPDIENAILENNLYGVDINEESVEIAKLALWLRTAKPNRKLNSLNENIKCGNSLISDPEVAGDKAFDWHKEFPQVFTLKNKKAYHITCATHNSRYSQRMADNHVKLGEPVWLSPEEELIVTQTIAQIAKDDKLNIIAYNICGDHMHLLLVCEDTATMEHASLQLHAPAHGRIIQKLKSMSARACNIAMGRTVPTAGTGTQEHAPVPVQPTQHSTTSEHAHLPLHAHLPHTQEHAPVQNHAPVPLQRGTTQNHLWTQKYGCTPIADEEHLQNTLYYIQNNRIKHELPASKQLEKLIQSFVCSIEQAFAPEYKGGFDVVIGNPPYVLCQPSNTAENVLNHYKTFEVASYKIDLFHLFFEKGINILKNIGRLGFITPNTYLTNKYIKPLRAFILETTDIYSLVNHEENVFPDASVDVATIILNKAKRADNHILLQIGKNNSFSDVSIKKQSEWRDDPDCLFNVKQNISLPVDDCIPLGEICYSYFGIQAFDRKSSISEIKEDENHLKIIDGGDILPYSYAIPEKYFNYQESNIKSGGDWNVYNQERIVVRQIGQTPVVGMSKANILASNTLYSIYTKNGEYNLKYILCILNSSFIKRFWLSKYSDSKQLFPKIKGYQLKELPIKQASLLNQQPFIEKADQMLTLNAELQTKRQRFHKRLSDNLDNGAYLIVITGALARFDELEFKQFVAELKKQKINLSLKEQDEWEEYFNSYKTECNALSSQIAETDKAIDQMVYALYGLTEEEIGIVEGK